MPKFTKYDLVAIEEKYRKGERLTTAEIMLLNVREAARVAIRVNQGALEDLA